MADQAVKGSISDQYPPTNVFDFTFSQPFRPQCTAIKTAPTFKHRQHFIHSFPSSKPVFVDPQTQISASWQDVRDDACRIATGLRLLLASENIGPYENVSPVVLIHLPNCVQYASVLFGVFAAGFTASLANPLLTQTELQHIIGLARPAAVVTTAKGWQAIKPVLQVFSDGHPMTPQQRTGRVFILDPSSTIAITAIDSGEARSISQLYHHDISNFEPTRLNEDDYVNRTCLILWSSGTTGKSKGVCHSHSGLVHNTISLWRSSLQFDGNERWLGFVPLYHVYGLAVIALMAPACGATVYVLPRFEPKLMLELIQRERITCLHLAPPVALLLAKSPMIDGVDMSSVKHALSGGAPLGKDIIEMVHSRLRIMIFMGYGLSEAGSVTHQDAARWDELSPFLGTSGIPVPGVEVRIASPEDSRLTLRTGEEGEICVRSRAVMLGYLNNVEATDETLQNGWYRTGDIGRLDTSGALTITDRMKEMIKVKGLQVSPADLEAILNASPQISDSAVTGINDPSTASEYPRAYIVPKASQLLDLVDPNVEQATPPELIDLAQNIKDWMEERTANYKWLRGGIVIINEVPKSPSGKILRRNLKDMRGFEVALYDYTDHRRTSRL